MNCIRVCSQALLLGDEVLGSQATRWPLLSIWAVGQEGCFPCSSTGPLPTGGPSSSDGYWEGSAVLHPAHLTWKGLGSLGAPPPNRCHDAFLVTSSTVYFRWVMPPLWPFRKVAIMATSYGGKRNEFSFQPYLIPCVDGEIASLSVGPGNFQRWRWDGEWEEPRPLPLSAILYSNMDSEKQPGAFQMDCVTMFYYKK